MWVFRLFSAGWPGTLLAIGSWQSFVQTTSKMSFVGRAGVDLLIQMNATQWAKYGTEYAASCIGAGKETQMAAGRVMETMTQVVTAFGMGDVDVTRTFASKALARQAHMTAVSRGLQSALRNTNEMAALSETNRQLINKLIPELDTNGVLGIESQQLAKTAADKLGSHLETSEREPARSS